MMPRPRAFRLAAMRRLSRASRCQYESDDDQQLYDAYCRCGIFTARHTLGRSRHYVERRAEALAARAGESRSLSRASYTAADVDILASVTYAAPLMPPGERGHAAIFAGASAERRPRRHAALAAERSARRQAERHLFVSLARNRASGPCHFFRHIFTAQPARRRRRSRLFRAGDCSA